MRGNVVRQYALASFIRTCRGIFRGGVPLAEP